METDYRIVQMQINRPCRVTAIQPVEIQPLLPFLTQFTQVALFLIRLPIMVFAVAAASRARHSTWCFKWNCGRENPNRRRKQAVWRTSTAGTAPAFLQLSLLKLRNLSLYLLHLPRSRSTQRPHSLVATRDDASHRTVPWKALIGTRTRHRSRCTVVVVKRIASPNTWCFQRIALERTPTGGTMILLPACSPDSCEWFTNPDPNFSPLLSNSSGQYPRPLNAFLVVSISRKKVKLYLSSRKLNKRRHRSRSTRLSHLRDVLG
ncbi:hypothetical protein BC830DRAFT_363157 [Chytriomyces sp. MP71]|nr:hypothetical protein BC830DRAFT_363157 [Chytriomyces sp. MP71]